MRTRDLIHHHVNNWLREAHGIARHCRQPLRHLLDEVRFRLTKLPGAVRFQAHAALHMREREGLRPLIVAPHLRHHIGDLFKLAQRLAQLRAHRL